MAKYILQHRACTLWLINNEEPDTIGDWIGDVRSINILRDGNEVLITSGTLRARSTIVPSNTTVTGFGSDIEGKALWELTDSGVICNYVFRPIDTTPNDRR